MVSLSRLTQVSVGIWDLPRELIHIWPCKWDTLLKLSTGNTKNLSKRQADIEHTLAEVQGPAELATIASLRERHVLSNWHKLFFYYSDIVLYTCTVAKGNLPQLPEMLKKKYIFIMFDLRFFPCSQMQMEQSLLIRGDMYA